MAQPIARQLIERGRVVRPYVGIVMQSITPELARSLGARAPLHGALVSEVAPRSPAHRAGVEPGDVAVAVGRMFRGKARFRRSDQGHARDPLGQARSDRAGGVRAGMDSFDPQRCAPFPGRLTSAGGRA